MRLGIDLGTTRVAVAAPNRGNYPIVSFETSPGNSCEWYPSLCAVKNGELRTGHAAQEVARDPSWQICRSLKRLLATSGPRQELLGMPAPILFCRFMADLKEALLHRSNLQIPKGEPLEVTIAVPANATANQRLLTADAFTQAGFRVLRILDEPTAAGLEYAWRRPTDAKVRRRHVAVYDLGGGTFDASVISMSDALHEVITTGGVSRLGGDDFDEVLLQLACKNLGIESPATGPERDRLLEICREEKERMTTATRRLRPDLLGNGREPNIPVPEFEAALAPLIAKTVEVLDACLAETSKMLGQEIERNTVVYQVGGASQLPAVARYLRERFGRRVWRSPYPHASVAIGLAIAAEEERSPRIQGRFTHYFGVWRERDEGQRAAFDPVFPKDTPLPITCTDAPFTCARRYRAAHNVGHFRFVECSRLQADGTPSGDVALWNEVRFALVPELRETPLDGVEVLRLPGPGQEVEERYRLSANGTIEVELANLSAGYQQTFTLGLGA
jgi:molecular chaperone DnaK (HSP70)